MQWEQPERATKVFDRMEMEKMEVNEVTLINVNVLAAYSRARDLGTLQHVHKSLNDNAFGSHLMLNTALMDVYSSVDASRLLEIYSTRS